MSVDLEKLSNELYPVDVNRPPILLSSSTFCSYYYYEIETIDSINRRLAYDIYSMKYMKEFQRRFKIVTDKLKKARQKIKEKHAGKKES